VEGFRLVRVRGQLMRLPIGTTEVAALAALEAREAAERALEEFAAVMHGEADQIVPYATSGPRAVKLVQNGTLKTYAGFPHDMPTTQADTINADLLAFIQS
jgi:pimeloyl-ACP methyl ester carboxylesterase